MVIFFLVIQENLCLYVSTLALLFFFENKYKSFFLTFVSQICHNTASNNKQIKKRW